MPNPPLLPGYTNHNLPIIQEHVRLLISRGFLAVSGKVSINKRPVALEATQRAWLWGKRALDDREWALHYRELCSVLLDAAEPTE
jgi:hypothetical protein